MYVLTYVRTYVRKFFTYRRTDGRTDGRTYARTYVVRTYVLTYFSRAHDVHLHAHNDPELVASLWRASQRRILAHIEARGPNLCKTVLERVMRLHMRREQSPMSPALPLLIRPNPLPFPDCVRTLRIETAHATYRTYVRTYLLGPVPSRLG